MSKDIILILSLALVVIAGWISADVYKALTETAAPVVTQEMLTPLDPAFDLGVLRDLKNRR